MLSTNSPKKQISSSANHDRESHGEDDDATDGINMTDSKQIPPPRWWSFTADEAIDRLGSNEANGLTKGEAAKRLSEHGPNELQSEAAPSKLEVAMHQVVDPMNLMLLAVAATSLVIGEISTALLVAALVSLNIVLGAQQEMKAKAAVDALAKLQVPVARVTRGGSLVELPATELVPGDIVSLEAGDLVPADGRILRSATLETQEAALTGESAPIPKDSSPLADEDIAIGDRSDMVFQNTSVTRGTGVLVVTSTGMKTEMGAIAAMLSSVERKRSPLQRELDSLTKILGFIAWGAVVVIMAIGVIRGINTGELLLLGTAMAISAIPTGLPTFVQGMLSYGAKQLAKANAIVKNLTDVETLGSTSAINSDKTGTLTMNEMMTSTLYLDDTWFHVEGNGYSKTGAIRSVAGDPEPDFTNLALALVLDSDAVVSDDGDVIGDPTEAALVVLAAKIGVDAEETRRARPRLAEVPFDSSYKFMSTVHRIPLDGEDRLILLTKGAPDVVLARCSESATGKSDWVSIADAIEGINAANERMGSEGLRVLSFAYRLINTCDEAAVLADPMSFVEDLRFVGLAGIIDPLRPSSKKAVHIAHKAGIDVRMITGDHTVTAMAIGKDLGLGSGAISGAEFREMSDEQVMAELPDLHVFGRVSPQDKLRLVQLMQADGMVVAMTGDAVNDAAALKQADIGVAMGSGSEVTKQAAKMILTDDNFGTLVHAVELGRSTYHKIRLYVRFQMSQLLSLVIIFLVASIFNIAGGVALTPMMVLWLNFLVAGAPVLIIMNTPVQEGLMQLPPRAPSHKLVNPSEVIRWLLYGGALFFATLAPLLWGPDKPSPSMATASMTMAFVVMGFGTLLSGLALRHDPQSWLKSPILTSLGILAIPAVLLVITTTWSPLQRLLMTQPLTAEQWLGSIGLALIVLVVIETEKWFRRRSLHVDEVQATPEEILTGSKVVTDLHV